MNSSADATATTSTREKPTFLDADTNRDGYVSRNEAQQAGVSDYSYADKNADGLLDADEFDAASSDSLLSPSEDSSSDSSSASSSVLDEPSQTTSSDAGSSMHEPNDATAMSRTR